MGFLDLIVGDVCTTFPSLIEIDIAQLNRRLGEMVRGLMLETELCDLCFEPRQVVDELFDHDRIEVDAGASQQQRCCFAQRHTAPERAIFTYGVETINDGDD